MLSMMHTCGNCRSQRSWYRYSQVQNNNDTAGAIYNNRHAGVLRNCECDEMWENLGKSLPSSKHMSLDFLTWECSGMSKTSTKSCLRKQTQRSWKCLFWLNVFFKNKLLQHIWWNSGPSEYKEVTSTDFQQSHNFISVPLTSPWALLCILWATYIAHVCPEA